MNAKLFATLAALLLVSHVSADGTDTSQTAAGIEPPTEAQAAEQVACTMDWRPVCGVDGNTYSNACVAGVAGVEVATEGECPAATDGGCSEVP